MKCQFLSNRKANVFSRRVTQKVMDKTVTSRSSKCFIALVAHSTSKHDLKRRAERRERLYKRESFFFSNVVENEKFDF